MLAFKWVGEEAFNGFRDRIKKLEKNTGKILIESLNDTAKEAKELGAKAVAGRGFAGEGKNIDIGRVRQEMLVVKADIGSQAAKIRVTKDPHTFREGGAYKVKMPQLGKSGVTEWQTGNAVFHPKWFSIRLLNSDYIVAAKRVRGRNGKKRVKAAYAPSVDQIYDDVIFNRLYLTPVERNFVRQFFKRVEE